VSASDYVDEALDALGGEDADFWVKGIPGIQGAPYAVGLFCRTCGPGAGVYSVGEMELWELVADAREHFVTQHAKEPVAPPARSGDEDGRSGNPEPVQMAAIGVQEPAAE
jgi:hypothetical protein